MEQAIQHGADVIIRDWVRLRAGERILIVSSQKYAVEVAAMQQAAQAVGSVADVLMLDDLHEQVGQYFDDREDAFDPYNAVIGAAEYSLITTRAVKRVIARRNRFLSLPLSTSNGQSLLSYDFLNMSLPKSRIMASIIMGIMKITTCRARRPARFRSALASENFFSSKSSRTKDLTTRILVRFSCMPEFKRSILPCMTVKRGKPVRMINT